LPVFERCRRLLPSYCGAISTTLTDSQLRERYERTARSLQGLLKSAATLTRNLTANERGRTTRLVELTEYLYQLDDRGLATDRDAELHGYLDRWQRLGKADADRFRASCRSLKPAR
jgi:hypothetical protein